MMKSAILYSLLGTILLHDWCKTVQANNNGPAIQCPLIDKKGIFRVFYSEGQNVNSTAVIQCRETSPGGGNSSYRICQSNGRWSWKNPVCARESIQCPLIDKEGIFNVFYSEGQNANSIAFVQCKNSMKRIRNSTYRVCQFSGRWSLKNPFCLVYKAPCTGLSPAVTDGNIIEKLPRQWSWHILRYVSKYVNIQPGTNISDAITLVLFCNTGYSVNGTGLKSKTLKCRENTWSSNYICLPNKIIQCPLLKESGSFNIIYSQEQRVNSTAFFSCKNNSQRIESKRFRICQADGQWSGENPVCVGMENKRYRFLNIYRKIQCPLIDGKGIFTVVYSKGLNVNSTAHFSCENPNQKIKGPDESVCQKFGMWSGTDPTCEGQNIQCPPIAESGIFNIVYSKELNVNSVARFSCKNDNMEIEGVDKRICKLDGQWSGTNPSCVDVLGCRLEYDKSSNLIVQMSKERFHFGESVNFFCPPSYKLTPHVVLAVCLGTRWSDSFPKCEKN